MTERDLVVLRWIGEQYAIRLDQLQRLMGRESDHPTKVEGQVTASTARQRVNRWIEAGLVETKKVFYREPAWVWLTRRGLREMSLDLRYWDPSVSLMNHLYWVNEVRLRMEERRGDLYTWRSERLLKPRWEKDEAVRHYADAEVETPDAVVGVEVEITRKKLKRIQNIIRLLYNRYTIVWYFVNDETENGVHKAKEALNLRRPDKVKIYPLEPS